MTTSDYNSYPQTIDVVGRYIYVSLNVLPDLNSANESIVISNAGGAWQKIGSLSAGEGFFNVLGSGEIDGALWFVGNSGPANYTDFNDGLWGWIWGLGRDNRTILDRVLEGDERVVAYARDAVDFKDVPIVVGYDEMKFLRTYKGVVWYRRKCRWQWPICQPD